MGKIQYLLILSGLLAIASFAPDIGSPLSAQPAPMDCGDLWADTRVPDARGGGAFPCYEYAPYNTALRVGPGTSNRIFFTAQWKQSPRPGQSSAYLEAVAEALDHSIRHFERHVRAYPINVIVSDSLALEGHADPLSPVNFGIDAVALGVWIDAGEACPIVTYAPPLSYVSENIGKVKQLIAHEVFHCFQAAHFGERLDQDYESTAWWVEGTAEYFSHAAYRCVNSEHDSSISYNPDDSILDQTYANVAFFQHLDVNERADEEGVMNFIREMSTDQDRAGQDHAASAVDDIEGRFHRFGRAYIDNDIPDCGDGGRMSLSVDTGPLEDIGPNGTVHLEASAFSIARARIRLMPGRRYTFQDNVSAGSGSFSARLSDMPGDWSELPDEITTTCEDAIELQVLATTTGAPESDYRIDIEFSSEEDPEAGNSCITCFYTGQHDACLVGTWRLRPEDSEQWLRQVYGNFNNNGARVSLNNFDIDARFTAAPDGTATGNLERLEAEVEFQMRIGDRDIVTNALLAGGGTSQSTWSTTDDGVLYGCPGPSNIQLTSQMVIQSAEGTITTEPYPIDLTDEAEMGFEFEYVCQGGQATITHQPEDLPPQIYRLQRQ